jgi:hypothetical protein
MSGAICVVSGINSTLDAQAVVVRYDSTTTDDEMVLISERVVGRDTFHDCRHWRGE